MNRLAERFQSLEGEGAEMYGVRASECSFAAGLDYPGVGPEHAWLKDTNRASYVAVDDKEALLGFHALTRWEGIIPALETSHALAFAERLAPKYARGESILLNLSGRGDKDLDTVAAIEGIDL